MDFLGLLKDLRGQIGKTALKRTGALTQLAGAVKGMSDALVSEADEAIREVGRARIRVYMPAKAKAVARTRTRTKTARVKDEEATYLQDLVKQQKKQTVERFAELRDLYIKLLKKSPEFSEADMAKRRKLITAVITKREETLAAKREREEEVREKHAVRFKGSRWEPKTAAIGKTEDYKAYMAELSEAHKKEQKETTEALGKGILSRFYLATTSEYKKEYEKAIKTGEIVKKGDDEYRETLIDKLGDHIETVKYSVSEMHEDMSTLFLGPFAGMYKTAKGFMFTTGKHFILERKERIKNWMLDRISSKRLLAEISYLRKEGKEVPAILRMQMMVSTAMNAAIGLLGNVMKYALAGLIAAAIMSLLQDYWPFSMGKKSQEQKHREELDRQSGVEKKRYEKEAGGMGEKLAEKRISRYMGLPGTKEKLKQPVTLEEARQLPMKLAPLPAEVVETRKPVIGGPAEKLYGDLKFEFKGINEGINKLSKTMAAPARTSVVQTTVAGGGGERGQVSTYLELMSSEDENINWPK